MKKEKANKEKQKKDKYFHVCGIAGMGYALWMCERLNAEGMCTLVDCSKRRRLIGYAKRKRSKCNIIDMGSPLDEMYSGEYAVFYHEQEDSFTDSYSGTHFFFVGLNDLEYTNSILQNLTNGKIRLFEETLLPQLGGGGKIYILAIRKSKVMGELFIRNGINCSALGNWGNKEQAFNDIFLKSRGERKKA